MASASTSATSTASAFQTTTPSSTTPTSMEGAIAAVLAAKPNTTYLTREQKKFWADNGCLGITAAQMWSAEELKALIDGVNLMDDWPDKAGHWMKYYEKKQVPSGDGKESTEVKLLQRIENFVQYNPALNALLRGKLEAISSELFDEAAILYKEKINYKMPGGAGFEPHQDISAGWWMYGQSIHISALVTIDEATPANGCLEVVYGKHKQGKLGPDWKAIPDEVCKTLDWVTLPTKPGDCFFFDSYVPHRSGPNTTDRPRRVLYATYAKLGEGDLRERYFADKRVSFPPDIERLPGKDYAYKI